jgi:hypothetical protein
MNKYKIQFRVLFDIITGIAVLSIYTIKFSLTFIEFSSMFLNRQNRLLMKMTL